ncbi:MAG: aminotransferase class I/II-fold pyridoxal phosphate-dependent enzyme [Lachnospiraceae bacterium]|nr:aminotransferase class I/II-fold pyridoxal phosphate-dependent enzyme [Lachnospiraceae bacterium]
MVIADEAFHGSDLENIAARYDINVQNIVPFASNVNPLGISPMARQALIDNIDAIKTYPDRNYVSLKNAISKYCKTEPDKLILGNGTSELISLTLKTIRPAKTIVIGPTYSEYGRSAVAAGSEIECYMLKNLDDFELDVETFLKTLQSNIDLLIICNPNNPTGKAVGMEDMEQIVKQCAKLHITVMVDETYVEFVKDVNQVSSVSLTENYDNLIVLRGVSKFFASPGLRLGYAVTSNSAFLEAANNDKIPWNINSYASVAGVMFEDEHYINLTKSLIQTERNLIYSALSPRKTIKVFKPDANFILIKLLKENLTADQVFEHCIKKGLMIRDCTDYEGLGNKYIRFCFMRPEQNDDVVNTILEIV